MRNGSLVFLGCWLLLLFQDVTYSSVIPQISKLRLLVPMVLLAWLFMGRPLGESRPLRNAFLGFLFLGLLSVLFGIFVELGLIKLALYISMIFPILALASILTGFFPQGPGIVLLSRFGVTAIGLALVHYILAGSSPFNNPNQAGQLAICLLPVLLYRMGVAASARELLLFGGAVVAALMLAYLSASRASLGASLIMVLVFISFMRTKSWFKSVIVMALISGVGAGLITLDQSAIERVAEVAYKGGNTFLDGYRMLMFQESWQAFQARPFFGYGFGLSWLVNPNDWELVLKYGRLSWFVGEFGNSTMALLVGGGVVLALFFYGMIGWVLVRALGSARYLRRDSKEYRYLIAMVSGIIGLMAHAQAEGWILSPLNWTTVIFWLYVGLAFSFGNVLDRWMLAFQASRSSQVSRSGAMNPQPHSFPQAR